MLHPFGRIFGLGDKADNDLVEEQDSFQDEVVFVNIDHIEANRYQPRSIFNEEKIKELAQTLHTHGMIQPIVVRPIENEEDKYEIIAGERRWRAARTLEWEKVPVIIREMTDKETASVALIENLQREELTVIEEAVAYQKLIDMHELTQEALAQRLGKSQSTIANKMRLLKLPEQVQQAILQKKITERHARALIALKEEELQLKVLEQIIERDLNVKQTEAQINRLLTEKKKPAKKPRLKGVNKDMRIAMNTIRQSLNMVTDTGIDLETDEQDHDDFYQITIKIPKKK
ncbi:nucleoid occlusion protein [Gracilibacillus sp. S3-1-1]|uniref:Nucleoid occlusion protein n=1 Tax=Gracilibacillus pellucidus TaxID=3095368 RepID=A0ACC6M3C2_9BACI|nr:nucleoid occlusion protein [Gracilibacillus sp. S3-1-1]MDX8045460.1 nucleoid occlusion protein [Gracilibacillus sp. S3-1-1]